VISKIRNSAAAQLWIVVAVAIAFFLAVRYLAIASGCGPHDHDRRCGMSTFYGQVFGGLGAIIIWIGASGQIVWAKRRRERRLRSERLHGEDSVDPEHDRGAAMLQNRLEDDRRRDAQDLDEEDRRT
jgi:hypothetical protein